MDLRDLIALAGIVNPELLNRIEATAEVEEADGAGFDKATTRPEETVMDDPMQSMGSDVDLSLRRYLKAKGDHVTVDENVYPDYTVEDVNEAYAAFKERAPHDRRGNIYGGNATRAAQDSARSGTLDPEQNMFLDPTLLPRMPSKMSSPKMPKKTNEADIDENAFNQAAAAAARANKDSFEFNGKTYKTKMDKTTAHKLDDDVEMLRKLAGLV